MTESIELTKPTGLSNLLASLGYTWKMSVLGHTLNVLQHVITKKISKSVLAGVAQWIECQPANQRVTGSIPSQGTCLGCGPDPQ